ncbi:MAG: recombinase family protein [Sporomusaceae bacterium]|nr:recombinase family protein [Sporomusaceae bacterium]
MKQHQQDASKEHAALYLRVSTEEQAEHGLSLSAQEVRLAAFCLANNWEIEDIYRDDGYSGKDLKRPAIQRLIARAKNKQIQHVVVLKLDRLSRRQKDTLYLIEDIFLPEKIGFHSVTESFDTTTPYGKAALGMMAVFAQLERETIIERVKMAKKEASRQGRWKGGEPPFGYYYNRQKKLLQIHPDEARHVKKIFELYLSGEYGFQAIANQLNQEKIATRQQVRWLKSTIRQILTNPTYIGKIRHYNEYYTGHHEALITEDTFELVQQRIQKRTTARPVKDAENLLTGLLFCACCGARLRFKTRHTNTACYKSYVCYTRLGSPEMKKADHCTLPLQPAQELNQKIICQLNQLIVPSSFLEQAAHKLLPETAALWQKSALQKEQESLTKRLNRLYEALETGLLQAKELEPRLKSLKNRQEVLAQKIKTETAPSTQTDLSLQALLQAFPSITTNWTYLTLEEQRTVLFDLIKKIIVHPDGSLSIELLQ